MRPSVLFLQGRTHRAGAQTCLARLLRHQRIRQWNPVVLCAKEGWLTQECRQLRLPVIVEAFPSSRSLPARLFGNRVFAKRVADRLAAASVMPAIVHANDHQEALLASAVARRLGAKTAITLRFAGMRREDYYKYRCNAFDYIEAIGDELTARVQAWDPGKKVACSYDGLFEEEFLPVKAVASSTPSKILVIGSPQALKGWADLAAALHLLEQEGQLDLRMQFDFTGDLPPDRENDLNIGRLASRCNFLGRTEAFRDLVRSYDLVINPSRMETFGMAAVEVLAAGVPLLSSRTGVIEEVQTSAEMLFEPDNPASLAYALKNVLHRWREMDFGVAAAQRNIRRKFMIDHAAAMLDGAYQKLLRDDGAG